jgi:hypothetical protein
MLCYVMYSLSLNYIVLLAIGVGELVVGVSDAGSAEKYLF